jgi:TonB family protein
MAVYIDEKGSVERVEVLEATVPNAFRDAAVKAFGEARWEPAVRHGRKVKSVKRVEVDFKAPLRELEPKA